MKLDGVSRQLTSLRIARSFLITNYAPGQDSKVTCLAQAGFTAFGKGVQVGSGSPYAETKELS